MVTIDKAVIKSKRGDFILDISKYTNSKKYSTVRLEIEADEGLTLNSGMSDVPDDELGMLRFGKVITGYSNPFFTKEVWLEGSDARMLVWSARRDRRLIRRSFPRRSS